jgi:hypothetical protein
VIAAQSGDHLRAVQKQARRRKDKATVEQIDTDRPDADRELILYVNLFLMCESDRVEALMPIPVTTMLRCIEHFELDDYQEDFILAAFPVADGIVLADRRTKRGNAPGTGNTDAGSGKRGSRRR